MARKKKLTKKQEKYLITKYMATAGGLKPKNIEIELADGSKKRNEWASTSIWWCNYKEENNVLWR